MRRPGRSPRPAPGPAPGAEAEEPGSGAGGARVRLAVRGWCLAAAGTRWRGCGLGEARRKRTEGRAEDRGNWALAPLAPRAFVRAPRPCRAGSPQLQTLTPPWLGHRAPPAPRTVTELHSPRLWARESRTLPGVLLGGRNGVAFPEGSPSLGAVRVAGRPRRAPAGLSEAESQAGACGVRGARAALPRGRGGRQAPRGTAVGAERGGCLPALQFGDSQPAGGLAAWPGLAPGAGGLSRASGSCLGRGRDLPLGGPRRGLSAGRGGFCPQQVSLPPWPDTSGCDTGHGSLFHARGRSVRSCLPAAMPASACLSSGSRASLSACGFLREPDAAARLECCSLRLALPWVCTLPGAWVCKAFSVFSHQAVLKQVTFCRKLNFSPSFSSVSIASPPLALFPVLVWGLKYIHSFLPPF